MSCLPCLIIFFCRQRTNGTTMPKKPMILASKENVGSCAQVEMSRPEDLGETRELREPMRAREATTLLQVGQWKMLMDIKTTTGHGTTSMARMSICFGVLVRALVGIAVMKHDWQWIDCGLRIAGRGLRGSRGRVRRRVRADRTRVSSSGTRPGPVTISICMRANGYSRGTNMWQLRQPRGQAGLIRKEPEKDPGKCKASRRAGVQCRWRGARCHRTQGQRVPLRSRGRGTRGQTGRGSPSSS